MARSYRHKPAHWHSEAVREDSLATYICGRPFLAVSGRAYSHPYMRSPRARPVLHLEDYPTWARLWDRVCEELRNAGYAESSLYLYRQVLRNLRASGLRRPADVTRTCIRDYIHGLADRSASWSWTASNISVLRAVFDKMGGRRFTVGLRTPKRPHRLPHFLHQHEVMEILSSAGTIRDQLILGLLYGCGLKVGELCRLRWDDMDLRSQKVQIAASRTSLSRQLDLPPSLIPVLKRGIAECPGTDYIFQGRRPESHLTARTIEYILEKAAQAAQIRKPVSAMILRHSYAVHCLMMGMTIIDVQHALGHKDICTTLLYEECIPRHVSDHPFTKVRACYVKKLVPANIPKVTSLQGLTLPFPPHDQSIMSRARAFYRTLRTRVIGSFLSLQANRAGPGS